ncbi:MAG: Hpt domain-containing protein, partial [Calditrichaeota bacterium]|nr:Hpt domain-containing protein [Calditrichota bacterium]
AELSYLLDEILSEPLVYTDGSAQIFSDAIEKIKLLLDSKNETDDQRIIDEIIEEVNKFNDSLALVDFEESKPTSPEPVEKAEEKAAVQIDDSIPLTKEVEKKTALKETYSYNDQLVRNNCYDIIAKSTGDFANFQQHLTLIRENYRIIDSDSHLKLLEEIESLSKQEAEFGYSEYKDLLIKDLHAADLESFKDLFAKQEDDHDLSADIKNDQKFSFDDILERPGVYENILLKKIGVLIESFDDENVESILVISSAIEFESRWLGYDQIADLFNFFTLNLDDYFNAKARSRLMEEFSKILSSVSKYRFNIEDFTEKADEEEIEEGLELENTQWINQVANILEAEEIDLSVDMATINFDAFADIDPDIQAIFNEEASSYITELERQLDQIDKDSGNIEAITLAEKAAHTLKGASRMLNVATIGDIAFKIEKVFENASITKKHVSDSHVSDIRHLLKIIKTIISGDEEKLKQALQETKSAQKASSEEDMEMLEIFQDESKTNIENIDQAIEELKKEVKHDSIKKMEADALSLKSAAKMLGFKKIGFLAESIERATETFRENTGLINEKTLDYLNDIVLLIKKLRLGEDVNTKAVENVINEFTSFLASQSLVQEQEDITDIVHGDLDEFQELFLEESASIISQLAQDIEKFISKPSDTKLRDRIQSDVHTVKGSASMVNFKKIHEIMNQIGLIIDASSNQEIDSENFELIKQAIAEVDAACERLKQGKNESSDQMKTLTEQLKEKL